MSARKPATSYPQAKVVLEEVVADQARAKAPATRHVLARAALAQTELGLGSPEAAAARAAEASAIATRFALPGKPSYWVGYGLLVQAEVDEARGRAASNRVPAAARPDRRDGARARAQGGGDGRPVGP